MTKDKFTAVWVSHSSISDYLKCPRAYFLKNVYRQPHNGRKITQVTPALALGQAVHSVIESLSLLPAGQRFTRDLQGQFEQQWETVSGKRGGFKSKAEESESRSRGWSMLQRVRQNPGPLKEKAVKIRQDLPYYWLSEEDNIILCGKIDWLIYEAECDSVKILDFKTGKYDEDPDSLQLPIYLLLVKNCQNRSISGAAYWYVDRDAAPIDIQLPDEALAQQKVLSIAKKIALARKLNHFVCPKSTGCRNCLPLEAIVAGKAELVGTDEIGRDVYVV